MKKYLFFLVSLSLFIVITVNAKDKEENTYHYELENFTDGTMPDGHFLVKVWNYGKKEKITRQLCMRNAIHGVIFKGVTGGNTSGLNKGHAALCPDGYMAHADYFDRFFNSGDYLQYVELSNNGNIQPGDRIKISNNEYKIGMLCIINFNALRDRLQKDGVAKGLNSLF
jgi:hypothetical protein